MPEITDAYLVELEALLISDRGNSRNYHDQCRAKLAAFPVLLAEVRRLRARYESTPKTPDVPNTWLTVNGKDYACKCGCALFNQPNRNISTYYCNKCGAEHEGMPV